MFIIERGEREGELLIVLCFVKKKRGGGETPPDLASGSSSYSSQPKTTKKKREGKGGKNFQRQAFQTGPARGARSEELLFVKLWSRILLVSPSRLNHRFGFHLPSSSLFLCLIQHPSDLEHHLTPQVCLKKSRHPKILPANIMAQCILMSMES